MGRADSAALPGRCCPLGYRYTPADIATDRVMASECLYVIGGLYGNPQALDAIEQYARREPVTPTLIFNGDFNWFNRDLATFERVNRRVLAHFALRGNVETELAVDNDEAGCGCAYPSFVGDAEVERSNRILTQLRQTARSAPLVRQELQHLPMHARVRVGDALIAIVHGDCESLAGWGLSQESLREEGQRARVADWFEQLGVSVIASSHSCLPVISAFATRQGRGLAINNGAAGMPNFRGQRWGVITRIALRPARRPRPLYSTRLGPLHVEALPVRYDHARWRLTFLANWPAGSAAHASYYRRIMDGPDYVTRQAVRLAAVPRQTAVPHDDRHA